MADKFHWCYETIKLRPNSPPLAVAKPCVHTMRPPWKDTSALAPTWITQAVREMLAKQKAAQQ